MVLDGCRRARHRLGAGKVDQPSEAALGVFRSSTLYSCPFDRPALAVLARDATNSARGVLPDAA
jgi:hypothetical protein